MEDIDCGLKVRLAALYTLLGDILVLLRVPLKPGTDLRCRLFGAAVANELNILTAIVTVAVLCIPSSGGYKA